MHLVNRVNNSGNGITNVAVDLAIEQAQVGHDVWVVSAGGEFVSFMEANGVNHIEIDFNDRTPIGVVRAHNNFRTAVRAIAPGIVHAHTMTATVVARAGQLGSRFRLVATVHNEYQMGASLMRLADAVVGVSAAVSEAMSRRGVRRSKLHTVLNGIVGSRRRPPVESDRIVQLPPRSIVAIGAVSERKGADVLVGAFESLVEDFPDSHLYFVGNVDWSVPVEACHGKWWEGQVHFVGFDPQPQRYLTNATAFVLASRREPLGLVILEALEAGVPVIASDVDGIPEALDFGKAGVLCKVADSDDVAAKIAELFRSDERRGLLIDAGRRHVSSFSVRRMSDQYEEVYASVVVS